ncbi:GNAT family N-acetyltransferase [Lachnoanaerobaculum umeaense]|uniref:GNAT family N-acetyltransferase n=1 Tax=Lachnoanaerobaculum umeaense TaxID=617123 RepID=A0A385PX55_9FIRM|nr:GNAT family N-acetyltransferase [Lachnoanaerobaculum umeaense]AYA98721.1 GNAT family N-acetyltransferase [Lachnoanaerobaculum umeaense]
MWIKKFTDINMMKKDIEIRTMTIEDYNEVMTLWKSIKGFKIRAIDDDFEHIKKFLDRNIGLSVVAIKDDHIVGSILSGHDGRQASFYHVCVDAKCRGLNIASRMVEEAIERLKEEGISKITLIAFKKNFAGNIFWKNQNWKLNTDINSYELTLNEGNISSVVA